MSTKTLWFTPTEFVTNDSTLALTRSSATLSAVEVTTTDPGLKWVSLGLALPACIAIKALRVCYQVQLTRPNTPSFVQQVRLREMQTPERAILRHEELMMPVAGAGPTCYVSQVDNYRPSGAVILELGLSFSNPDDKIILGAVGVDYETLSVSIPDVKCFGAIGDGASHPLTERFATLAEAQTVYPHAVNLTDENDWEDVEIDWAAMQAAIDATAATGGGVVAVPPGVYRCNRQVVVPNGISFEGAGVEATTITFAGASAGNFPGVDEEGRPVVDATNTVSRSCIVARGSLSPQLSLYSSITKGDSMIKLSVPSPDTIPDGINEGDVLLLENDCCYSFNPARCNYHAGEFFHVYHFPYLFLLKALGAINAELDASRLHSALRQQFEANGHTLSPSAVVVVEEVGSKWIINDGLTQYRVRNENYQLTVYDGRGDELFRLTPVEVIELDAGRLYTTLWGQFEAKGYNLSSLACVIVVEAGSKWKIQDGAKTYIIRLVCHRLTVYLSAFATDTLAIATDSPAFDDYSTESNIKVWKMNPVQVSIRNMTVIGIGETNSVAVIGVTYGRRCVFENLKLSNSQYACLAIHKSFECQAMHIWVDDFHERLASCSQASYGIAIGSSQRINIAHCKITVRRHAVAMGGSWQPGLVPCRQVQVSDSVLIGLESTGADMHGNCEFCSYHDCTIHGGVTLNGDNNTLMGNTIFARTNDGLALSCAEWIGVGHTITGNQLIAVTKVTGSPSALIRWDRHPPENITRSGGTLRFINNRIDMRSHTGIPVQIRNNFAETDLSVEFIGNTITRLNDGSGSDGIIISGVPPTDHEGHPSVWRRIVVEGNTSFGAGFVIRHSGAETVYVHDNRVMFGHQMGIRVEGSNMVPWDKQFIDVCGNNVDSSYLTGIYVRGDDRSKSGARITGNVALRSGRQGSGNSALRSAVYLQNLNVAEFRNNVIGDDQTPQTQKYDYCVDNIALLVESDNTPIGRCLPISSVNIVQEVKHYADQARRTVAYGAAPPANGAWEVGDICWNRAPSPSAPIGWQCVAAGEPGAWQVMGLGQRERRTGEGAPTDSATFLGEEYLDTSAHQWYKAVNVGHGLADWVTI